MHLGLLLLPSISPNKNTPKAINILLKTIPRFVYHGWVSKLMQCLMLFEGFREKVSPCDIYHFIMCNVVMFVLCPLCAC